ncbi:MAG: alpha/beta-type small acid-soluble spore protein [Clostridiales bacterium]|jgi:hypothetical protein|nr:alpha/beta-type small acid-soluble spore protein [Clostridiales bacterium]
MDKDGKEKNSKEKKLSANDILKYEIANELGLLDKVKETGWKSLTAKESGRIGGIMTKRKRDQRAATESQSPELN